MHLLHVKTRKLETYFDRKVPEYAILSHTWGDNEFTFQDFRDAKRGWWKRRITPWSKKIDGCCAQAASDGIQYVWIDTICINKSSSAELSEAINSMYRWYAEAAVCYVYLSDVRHSSRACEIQAGSGDGAKQVRAWSALLEPALVEQIRRSRWFTRGWTLQELLAPSRSRFFDADWKCVGYSGWACGTFKTLNGQASSAPRLTTLLAEITGIPSKFLLSHSQITEASIAMRMSWAAGRRTTRIEDTAYCLLGLFGVNIPLLYGEGEGAFVRLQEEIMKKYDDHSIFTWGLDGYVSERQIDGETPLALSPEDFKGCRNVNVRLPALDNDPSNHYVATNTGIYIDLPLIPLRSGEYLARLNCTVDSGDPDIFLEDKYLCLILIQSRGRKRVFYRRTTASPTLISMRYFEKSSVRDNIYLSPTPIVRRNQTRTSPLFLSRLCDEYFTVLSTYPSAVDIHGGVYDFLVDLWGHHGSELCIFLDCIGYDDCRFTIRVRFTWDGDGVDTPDWESMSATMHISHQREFHCMAELMMPLEMEPSSLRWEVEHAIKGRQILLMPAGENQWGITIAPEAA